MIEKMNELMNRWTNEWISLSIFEVLPCVSHHFLLCTCLCINLSRSTNWTFYQDIFVPYLPLVSLTISLKYEIFEGLLQLKETTWIGTWLPCTYSNENKKPYFLIVIKIPNAKLISNLYLKKPIFNVSTYFVRHMQMPLTNWGDSDLLHLCFIFQCTTLLMSSLRGLCEQQNYY